MIDVTALVNASAFVLHPSVLLLALLLDLAIGDPRWLPHPVRIMGCAISKTEAFLRKCQVPAPECLCRGSGVKCRVKSEKLEVTDKFRGILLVITIVGVTFGAAWFTVHALSLIPSASHFLLLTSCLLLVYLTSTTIAVRELIDSAKKVIEEIKSGSLQSAREMLSMIVGRDTATLSDKEALKATMETLSENLSDGVVAPLFYLAVGGLPAAMTYKAINTLDSMVGYKNEKYINLGWASARLDDIANYIPARLTGILIAVSSIIAYRSLFTVHYSLKTMLADGRKHLSPNAGIPEAAMAGALGVRFGGPSTYGGMLVEKPYIGIDRTDDYLSASLKAVEVVRIASLLAAGIAATTLYLRGSA